MQADRRGFILVIARGALALAAGCMPRSVEQNQSVADVMVVEWPNVFHMNYYTSPTGEEGIVVLRRGTTPQDIFEGAKGQCPVAYIDGHRCEKALNKIPAFERDVVVVFLEPGETPPEQYFPSA